MNVLYCWKWRNKSMLTSLQKSCISLGTISKTKDQLLQEISRLAKKSSYLSTIPVEIIEDRLKNREQISSTGLENGLAIPHCSFDELNEFTVGLIIAPNGVGFHSSDGKPSKLIFFIIGPSNQRNKHIQIISSISKLSSDNVLINQLISSESANSAYDLLQRDLSIKETNWESKTYCQFTIHIQNEDFFSDVLEVLSSEVEGSISVLETNTAGYYLHKLPLFSTFWSSSVPTFSKIIFAIVNKNLMNDTLRRIKMLKDADKPGMLVTVHDLIYWDGSIDF